jgi:glutaredoxin
MAAFQLSAARRHITTTTPRWMASVSGPAYTSETQGAPNVTLFTKEGCTLCDKVKEALVEIRNEYPHSLEQIDITDDGNEDWFSKYKYDIPVLHIGDKYWIKHRIDVAEAKLGLTEAAEGSFKSRKGEPDAGAMEKRQAER